MNKSLRGVFCCTVDKGIILLLLGAAHSLLLASPQLQLLVLASIELLWIFSKLIGLIFFSYERQLFVWLIIIDGLNRIIFQFTLWLYEKSIKCASDSTFIDSQIQMTHILVMIAIWMIYFVASLWIFVSDLIVFSKNLKNSQNNSRTSLK